MNTKEIRQRWLRARRFRSTATELRAMSSPDLGALGIRRHDIPGLAAKAARL